MTAPDQLPHQTQRTPSAPLPSRLLTTQEAAACLGVCKRVVQAEISAGRLTSTKIGAARRIHPDDLRDYMDRCRGLRPGERAARVQPRPLATDQTVGVLAGARPSTSRTAAEPRGPRAGDTTTEPR